ncbi:hypothetical protein ACH4TV_31130 [Streptomyces sp. NPDC020898]|uniref:hypothetical protein n=1 Tax=Streptomyces sp. NPDC020898 TaxID=3365101 RepID=UPI00379D7CAC
MRSARLLLATATATAALAIAAPGAFAADGGDWDNGDSSYSKEHDKDSKHDKPNGGMHTGGGALTSVNADDWAKDETKDEAKDESSKKDWEADKEEQGGKGGWGSKHDKPNGGMHTGGGALTSVNADDWTKDESSKKDWEADKEEQGGKGGWGSKHEKPSGGMHTGGGALAAPGVTAGGLAALAVVGVGAYTMRRRNAADGVS